MTWRQLLGSWLLFLLAWLGLVSNYFQLTVQLVHAFENSKSDKEVSDSYIAFLTHEILVECFV